MLPILFEWGKSNIQADWSEYKTQLLTSQYLKLHPSNEQTMVMSATTGFLKYHHHNRLLDHLRVDVGENPTWEAFQKSVDKFIGDTHRSQFQQAIIRNDNGIASMSAACIGMEKIAINAVQNQFKALNPKAVAKTNKGKGKNNSTQNKEKAKGSTDPKPKSKGKGKGTEKPTPSKKSEKSEKTGKEIAKKEPCAWCSSEAHKTFQCVKRGDGKWENKQCNICKGFGHPRKACPNFVKK